MIGKSCSLTLHPLPYPSLIVQILCISCKFLLCLFSCLVYSAGYTFQQPEIFEFDHIHAYSNIGSPVAILYGALGTDCFRELHYTLTDAAKEVCYLHSRIIIM